MTSVRPNQSLMPQVCAKGTMRESLPRPPRPNRRPDLVDDGGGGGFCKTGGEKLDCMSHGSEGGGDDRRGGWMGRWVGYLNLGGGGRPRLAHRIGTMHGGDDDEELRVVAKLGVGGRTNGFTGD